MVQGPPRKKGPDTLETPVATPATVIGSGMSTVTEPDRLPKSSLHPRWNHQNEVLLKGSRDFRVIFKPGLPATILRTGGESLPENKDKKEENQPKDKNQVLMTLFEHSDLAVPGSRSSSRDFPVS